LIKRIDKEAEFVAAYASYVVIYYFKENKSNETNGEWEKENVEGPLFIVRRKVAPWFRLIVLNRTSPNNLVVPIDDTFEYELNGKYLIIRNDAGIRGVWFSDDEERLKIPGVLEAADSQRKPKDARPKEDAPTTPTTQQPGSHLPQQFRAHQGHNFQQGYPPHSSPAYPFPGSNIGMSPADTQRMIEVQARNMSIAPGRLSAPANPVSPLNPNTFSHNHSQANEPSLLSKQQMQEVLLKLIKNDRFVDLLHKEYVTSQQRKHNQR